MHLHRNCREAQVNRVDRAARLYPVYRPVRAHLCFPGAPRHHEAQSHRVRHGHLSYQVHRARPVLLWRPVNVINFSHFFFLVKNQIIQSIVPLDQGLQSFHLYRPHRLLRELIVQSRCHVSADLRWLWHCMCTHQANYFSLDDHFHRISVQ